MNHLYTIPSQNVINRHLSTVPDYMRPNKIPNAAVIVGALSPHECRQIISRGMEMEPYAVQHCGAVTREMAREPIDEVLRPLCSITETLNSIFWKYELDPDPTAWLQTYGEGGDYSRHTDTAPAQMRKLTAVLMLSDPEDYSGGDLRLHFEPRSYPIDRIQGTIVVFQPWIPHEVTKVTRGIRQTINLGFWGPPFR